jgi:uncharacterized protein YxeA
MYQITDYTKQRAKKIGVDIKPSTRKHKKIDVYHQGEYIASIGDVRYSDFPTYLKERMMQKKKQQQQLLRLC